MASNERVRLGETSSGKGARRQPGRRVDLPVGDLASGRSFVAGEPGSGASNTAGLLARAVTERGFGALVVDDVGEHAATLGAGESLHVGGTPVCDLRLDEDRAGPLAALALEGDLPVVFDRSTYRDDEAADAALASLARRLFALAEDRDRPFLVVVEDVDAYLPEGDPDGDPGRILRRIARRGGARDLGVCGVSRHPASVDRAFVESCDRRVWHRLTRHDETKVLRRRLDGERASAVRDLADREAFLVTGRSGAVRRVAVDRAGPAPGGPGGDAVLGPRRERVAELRDRLDERGDRIAALEARLETAREVDDAADRFVDRLLDRLADASIGVGNRDGEDEPESAERRRPDGETASWDLGEDATSAFGDLLGDGTATSSNGNGTDGPTAGDDGAGPSSTGDGTDDGAVGDGLAALAGAGATNGREPDDDPSGVASAAEEGAAGGSPAIPSVASQVADFERGASAGVLADHGAPDGTDGRPAVVARLEAALASLDERALALLSHYREAGPDRPVDAHETVTGWSDRGDAYRHNRALRRAGLVEHVGRGLYDYCLPATVEEACDDERNPAAYARDLEQEYLGSSTAGDRSRTH